MSKKIIVINDLSSYGSCSISVILPILTTLGMEVIAVPTAVLSTHNGYENPYNVDMTDFLFKSLEHYKKIGVDADYIYSGYINSPSQIQVVSKYFENYENAKKIVDPVMADNGKLYGNFNDDIVDSIKQLCKKADIITPNFTEAKILLGQETFCEQTSDLDEAYILVRKLAEIYSNQVVVTGVRLTNGETVNLGYDKKTDEISKIDCNMKNGNFSGTGDCFASVVIGYLSNGFSLEKSLRKATDFIERTIDFSVQETAKTKSRIIIGNTLNTLNDWR